MVFAVVFAVLGLTPSLSWIPEAPLLIIAFVVPVGGLVIAGYRGGVGAGTLAGAMTGLAGGLAYVAFGKSFVNVPVGLVAGFLAGAVLGWIGGKIRIRAAARSTGRV